MRNDPMDLGRGSLTEDVYERLRAAILEGRYLPEHKLKISALCGAVQGSLGAVREALSRLRSEGLVESEAYKGFYVAAVSPLDLVHLTHARIEVEKLCLASSLTNGDIAWEGRLIALEHQLSRYSASDDVDEWSRLHAALHDALVSACDNSWLLRMHRTLHEQSERYRRLALTFGGAAAPRPVKRDVPMEHREIVEAAIARDVVGTGILMTTHLQRTTDDLLRRLEARSIAAPPERRRRRQVAAD
jgi:GntR family carbon starvation induced transcriptional regulator